MITNRLIKLIKKFEKSNKKIVMFSHKGYIIKRNSIKEILGHKIDLEKYNKNKIIFVAY